MQLVFKALADPTRRAVIELLSQKPMSIDTIYSEFDLSRNAVVKHLRILEEAGIVHAQSVGREKINTLNPKKLKVAAEWLSYFDHFWDERLDQLKQLVETDYEQTNN